MNFIEDNENISIITLFNALFYKDNKIEDDIINKNPDESIYIYLQEIIKSKYINLIRSKKCIFNQTISEIRNDLYFFGYESDSILEIYKFLMDKLCGIKIKISFLSLKLEETEEELYYITLKFDCDESLRNKFEIWKKNIHPDFDFDNQIKINNLPKFISFYIFRENECSIDITTGISFDEYKWKFYSLIGMKNNKLYVVIKQNKKLYILENNKITLINELNKTSYEYIKKEVFFVIYCRDLF